MVLYVAYKAPKNAKDRSLIPKRLRALGCVQIQKSFWKVEEENAGKALRGLQKNRPVLLRRIREIRKPRLTKEEGAYELGSLVVVMYKTTKEVKRGKIRGFLRKAPCIRLCRSVYAFCQKHSLFDNRELVDADLFSQRIQEIGGDVKVIPRIVIVNSDSVEKLLDETREHVENEFSDIVRCCKELYQKASGEEEGAHHIRSMLPKLKRRHFRAKKVAAFYEKWLKIDFSKSAMMSYRALRKVYSAVNKKSV
ncbi:MAG: hypothetical protein OEZ25_05505 [Candidatus Bathyarchaeota archaeon]|nr:hypothetical protein [Candidatus Bathyarchaeota archaeon]